MKLMIGIIATLILGFLSTFLPMWWGFAIAAFLVAAFLKEGAGKSFLMGFLSILFLWGGMAFMMNGANDGILATRVAGMFGLSSAMMIIVVTAVVGSLVGGFAAMTGSLGRKMLTGS